MRNQTADSPANSSDQGEGFILITFLALLLPLVVLVSAFSNTMTGHSAAARLELDEEIALCAAESGVDEAIYRGQTGTLTDGLVVTRDLGFGQSYTLTATHLLYDLNDNDIDGLTDAADTDEDVFQVIVVGRYRDSQRRIASYLGPEPLLPTPTSAVATMDPSITIDLRGTPLISGVDRNIDGTAGPGPDVPGISIAPPGTLAHLNSEINGGEAPHIVGAGGTPSTGVSAAVDITTIVDQMRNIADIVLTSDRYSAFNFGDARIPTTHITYREGDVRFGGNTRGAGILVVTGNLEIRGTFRFDGIIIVLGAFENSAGTADVYGSILQGPSGGIVDARGTLEIHYSSEAISIATAGSGSYTSFNGWQELSKS